MIGIDVLIHEIEGLDRPDLQRWIDNDWVRPGGRVGAYAFHEIDVERIRLIQELRHGMQIDEEALPVILMLLDQIYDLRRRMHALHEVMEQNTTGKIPQAMAQRLKSETPE